MTYQEFTCEGPDGRSIAYATMGDAAGPTVFFHHGTPSASPQVQFFAMITDQSDFFFVTMTRAGFGPSTRRPGRSIGDVVEDVETVLDHLGRDTYFSLGWSGGGPHSLACAALGAPRCRAAWSLAGVAPSTADIDWTEGMGPENVEEFALAKEGGPKYEAQISAYGEAFAKATKDDVVELFGGLLSDPDKAVFEPEERREAFASSLRQGFEFGSDGFYDDDRAIMTEWGFDPTTITVPVSVWFGDHDLMVPRTHGEWLAANLPTSVRYFFPGDGHVTLVVSHLDELSSQISALYA